MGNTAGATGKTARITFDNLEDVTAAYCQGLLSDKEHIRAIVDVGIAERYGREGHPLLSRPGSVVSGVEADFYRIVKKLREEKEQESGWSF